MANYNPPTEDITSFNTLLFNQPEVILSQAEADLLYLSKVSSTISTAGSTSFSNAVSVGGNFSTTAIKSSTTAGANVLFDNMIASGALTIGGTASTNSIRGNTTLPQNVIIGTDGGTNDLSIKGEQRLYDTASPYTSYAKISNLLATAVPSVVYESPNVASSSHVFKCYNSLNTLTSALFDITSTTNISRQTLTLVNRLNFSSATTYSFPFASNTSLGYVLKNTGSSIATPTFVSATATTMSTISLPIGVWRVDFAVQTTVNTSGTITAAQSYIATSAAPTTQLLLTGSLVRSHVSEVYTAGDVQVIASSFTLSVSTTANYVLTILRTFATGAYTFTGEISITRLA